MKKSDVDGGLRETNKFFKGREFKVSTAYKPPPHIFCDIDMKHDQSGAILSPFRVFAVYLYLLTVVI